MTADSLGVLYVITLLILLIVALVALAIYSENRRSG